MQATPLIRQSIVQPIIVQPSPAVNVNPVLISLVYCLNSPKGMRRQLQTGLAAIQPKLEG